MKALASLLLFACVAAQADDKQTVEYECHYQAQKLERLIVLRASGEAGPGQAYLLALQALKEEGRDTEAWRSWMKRGIKTLWDDPNSVFFSPMKNYQEYAGLCMGDPRKFLINQSVIR